MSDLLSPLLVVMDNEADTFWCFVGLMNIVVRFAYCNNNCSNQANTINIYMYIITVEISVLYHYLY